MCPDEEPVRVAGPSKEIMTGILDDKGDKELAGELDRLSDVFWRASIDSETGDIALRARGWDWIRVVGWVASLLIDSNVTPLAVQLLPSGPLHGPNLTGSPSGILPLRNDCCTFRSVV